MDSDRMLIPYDDAMHMLGGIGRTKFYELIQDGELDQVKIGRRRSLLRNPLPPMLIDSVSRCRHERQRVVERTGQH